MSRKPYLVVITGDIKRPLTLILAVKDQWIRVPYSLLINQIKHNYSGVVLATIMKKAGFAKGEELKIEKFKKIRVVKSSVR